MTKKWPKESRKRKKVIELLLPTSSCGTLKKPQNTPPLKRGILWAWRLPCRTKKSQAPIKSAQPLPVLELRAEKSWGFFWDRGQNNSGRLRWSLIEGRSRIWFGTTLPGAVRQLTTLCASFFPPFSSPSPPLPILGSVLKMDLKTTRFPGGNATSGAWCVARNLEGVTTPIKKEFALRMVSLRAQRLKKKSVSLEILNLAWKLQSHLKCSILTFWSPHKNRFSGRLAWKFQSRLKISIPEGDLEFFLSLGPLGFDPRKTSEEFSRIEVFPKKTFPEAENPPKCHSWFAGWDLCRGPGIAKQVHPTERPWTANYAEAAKKGCLKKHTHTHTHTLTLTLTLTLTHTHTHTHAHTIGISQKGSPERCRFRFFPFSSVFFRFFPFSSVFVRSFEKGLAERGLPS